MIKVEGISMMYGGFRALNNVSFEVKPGEIVGLLGPNGAGKSTTMKILTTYLRPITGSAVVNDIDVVDAPILAREKVGYLPEILPLYGDMEVCDYLEFVARARGLSGAYKKERIDWVVEKVEIRHMYRKLCSELSKGYKQRVGLAQALVHDPDTVILDEPTSGLDPLQIRHIRDLIRELGKTKTVILSTHILQEANAVADRIVIINQGQIVGDGSVDELRRRAHPLEKAEISIYGEKDGIMNGIKNIEGCELVAYIDEQEGCHRFSVEAQNGDLLMDRIGALAKDKSWQVKRLKDIPFTLEETFIALTEKGGQ